MRCAGEVTRYSSWSLRPGRERSHLPADADPSAAGATDSRLLGGMPSPRCRLCLGSQRPGKGRVGLAPSSLLPGRVPSLTPPFPACSGPTPGSIPRLGPQLSRYLSFLWLTYHFSSLLSHTNTARPALLPIRGEVTAWSVAERSGALIKVIKTVHSMRNSPLRGCHRGLMRGADPVSVCGSRRMLHDHFFFPAEF